MADSPGKDLYARRVGLLIDGQVDRQVDEFYHEDAVLVSFDKVVRGHDALKDHFRNFVKWVGLKEVISTDRFTETDHSYFYEATAVTDYGVSRVYDAYYLQESKIVYHFTGVMDQ